MVPAVGLCVFCLLGGAPVSRESSRAAQRKLRLIFAASALSVLLLAGLSLFTAVIAAFYPYKE